MVKPNFRFNHYFQKLFLLIFTRAFCLWLITGNEKDQSRLQIVPILNQPEKERNWKDSTSITALRYSYILKLSMKWNAWSFIIFKYSSIRRAQVLRMTPTGSGTGQVVLSSRHLSESPCHSFLNGCYFTFLCWYQRMEVCTPGRSHSVEEAIWLQYSFR